jgi:hypothetical protein
VPPELRNDRFDLVYSNSVIEHVGGHARREAFAASVAALLLTTGYRPPYRYFPVEPHWVFPLMQNMPIARAFVLRHWSMGGRAESWRESVGRTLSVELLTRTEMSYYFATLEIRTEYFWRFPGSLIAVRRAST